MTICNLHHLNKKSCHLIFFDTRAREKRTRKSGPWDSLIFFMKQLLSIPLNHITFSVISHTEAFKARTVSYIALVLALTHK